MRSGISRSGLPPDRLAELLESFRTACAMADRDAVVALDRLVAGVVADLSGEDGSDEAAWQRIDAFDAVDRLHDQLRRVRSGLLEPGPRLLWDAHLLRQLADQNRASVDRRIDMVLEPEMQALRRDASDLADEAEVAAYIHALKAARTQPIHSASTVRSILAELESTAAALKKRERWTEELDRILVEAKERAARFRAQRKLDEAEVALAGASHRKAERLRNAAAVLLAQDWALAFPGETPTPTIYGKTS